MRTSPGKCGIVKGKDGQMRTDHVGMRDVGIKDEGHKVFSASIAHCSNLKSSRWNRLDTKSTKPCPILTPIEIKNRSGSGFPCMEDCSEAHRVALAPKTDCKLK